KTLTAEDEHPRSGRQVAAAIDQHAWLDPRNGVIYVKNIAEALARADAAHASDYRARAAAYSKELQDIAAWAKTEISAVPAAKRRVLSSHDSMQYLGHALGITLISINGWTNKSEPTASELGQLTDQLKK